MVGRQLLLGVWVKQRGSPVALIPIMEREKKKNPTTNCSCYYPVTNLAEIQITLQNCAKQWRCLRLADHPCYFKRLLNCCYSSRIVINTFCPLIRLDLWRGKIKWITEMHDFVLARSILLQKEKNILCTAVHRWLGITLHYLTWTIWHDMTWQHCGTIPMIIFPTFTVIQNCALACP